MKEENDYRPIEDLSNIKVGDRVYDTNIGWGSVYSLINGTVDMAIAVDFSERDFWTYNKNGQYSNSTYRQSLFTYNPFIKSA